MCWSMLSEWLCTSLSSVVFSLHHSVAADGDISVYRWLGSSHLIKTEEGGSCACHWLSPRLEKALGYIISSPLTVKHSVSMHQVSFIQRQRWQFCAELLDLALAASNSAKTRMTEWEQRRGVEVVRAAGQRLLKKHQIMLCQRFVISLFECVHVHAYVCCLLIHVWRLLCSALLSRPHRGGALPAGGL